jgi:hypothetical protein
MVTLRLLPLCSENKPSKQHELLGLTDASGKILLKAGEYLSIEKGPYPRIL